MKIIAGSILAGLSLLTAVQIFIGTRIIVWLLIALGIVLIIWGLQEAKKKPAEKS